MEAIANRISNIMVENHVISESDFLIYSYGIQALFIKMIGLVEFGLIGFIFNRTFYVLLFYASFSLLRKYSGGYHASSPVMCSLVSCLAELSVIIFEPLFTNRVTILGGAVLIMMIIGLKIGPVNHPNINWSDVEYRVIRRKLKKQFILIACLLVLLIIVGIPIRIVYYISAGSIINVLLMIAAKITGQEVKMDEQEENNSTTACKACSEN